MRYGGLMKIKVNIKTVSDLALIPKLTITAENASGLSAAPVSLVHVEYPGDATYAAVTTKVPTEFAFIDESTGEFVVGDVATFAGHVKLTILNGITRDVYYKVGDGALTEFPAPSGGFSYVDVNIGAGEVLTIFVGL